METVMGSKRIHAFWPTGLVLGSLAVLFTGERILGGDPTMRTGLAVAAAVMVAVALGKRAQEMSGASEDKKDVRRLLLLCTAGTALGLVLYALIPLAFSDDAGKTARAILWVLSPIAVACSVFPMVTVELAVQSVAFIDRYEQRRVRHASERGVALGLALSALFVGNYLMDRHDAKWDLSYGQKARMSEQTSRAIRDLTEPVKITLFFPRANEVAEVLEPYFDSVRAGSPQVTVTRVDFALAGETAKEAGVTENGYVSVGHGKAFEKIRLGEKMSSAKSSMRKFDQNFLTALLKVTREKKIAYFTTGHEERSAAPDSKDTRPPVKLLKQLLEANQYTVKNLGIAEGLADKLPRDGAVIFVMGPEKEFSAAELETLKKGLDQGARLFIGLEAEREGQTLDSLLQPLGLKFDRTILANDRTNVPFTKTEADRNFIWSNRYSSHESVTTMTRNAKLATVFGKTGSLTKLDQAPERTKVEMVLTAIDDTYAGDKKSGLGLAAAITRTSTTGKKTDETRVFVTADTDVFADDLLKFEGNVRLLADIVYWLRAVEEPVVPTVSEADVQIVHRKEGDLALFWGTTVGVPALVLAFGFVITRRRRRS